MEYSGIVIVIIGLIVSNWVKRVYIFRNPGDHPPIFWNQYLGTFMIALPIIIMIIGIIISFIFSLKIGISSLILAVLAFIIF
jgi:hypothetical protein